MLSKWQTSFILIITLPIMMQLIMLPLVLNVAGRDTLIAIFISLPVAILLSYAIFRLRVDFPDATISEISFSLIGKWGSRLIKLIFILYFLFLTILSFTALVDFVYIGFLPETPIIVLIVWFLIFFLYATSKGFKPIALTAGILALLSIFLWIIVFFLDLDKKDWSEMFPLFEFGWSPVIWGSLILTSIWMELLLLLCVPIKNIQQKRFYLFWALSILIVGLTMLSTTNNIVTIFGLDQAKTFNYPAQKIVLVLNFGFIYRIDIYGLFLATAAIYIRCSLFFRIAYELRLPNNPTKWLKRILFTLFSLFTLFGTYYLTNGNFRFEKAINMYAYMIVLFPIPFVLWFISWIKKRRKAYG